MRTTILGLLRERAATVAELAEAVERPTSTVAHHVKVLVDAGLLQVVRTRRVRAVEERFYGRTARMFYVSLGRRADGMQVLRSGDTVYGCAVGLYPIPDYPTLPSQPDDDGD